MSQFKPSLWIVLAILACVPLASAEVGTISTRGSATVEAPPDRARIEVGVMTTATDAAGATEANAEIMQRVLTAVRRLGITETDLKTTGLQVQPIWSQRNNRDRHITGFQVSNRVQVTTRNLDLAGTILQTAVAAGANTAGSLQFDVADPAPLRQQALHKATRSALEEANTIAKAAGVTTGAIVNLSTQAPAPRPMAHMRMMEADMAMSSAATPVSPGQISVRADVHLTIGIQSEESSRP